METKTLVLQAQQGEIDSFNQLYERYKKKLYYAILRKINSPEDAEEVMQETFIEAYKRLGTLKEPEKFENWLCVVGSRKCVAFYRKKERTVKTKEDFDEVLDFVEEEETDSLPEDALKSKEVKEVVMQLIAQLPEVQRSAVIMYYYEELSIRQIAEIQECSEGTVKARLAYARKKIKETIETAERKGTPLIAFAPFPVLVALLKEEAQACALPEDMANRIWQSIAKEIAKPKAIPKIGKKAGMSAAAKVAVGIVAAAVVGGVAVAGMRPTTQVVPPVVASVVPSETLGVEAPTLEASSATAAIQPVTFAEYAALFYQYVQENHVGKTLGEYDSSVRSKLENAPFLDAEMIDCGEELGPRFFILYGFDATGEGGEFEGGYTIRCLYYDGGFHEFLSSSSTFSNIDDDFSQVAYLIQYQDNPTLLRGDHLIPSIFESIPDKSFSTHLSLDRLNNQKAYETDGFSCSYTFNTSPGWEVQTERYVWVNDERTKESVSEQESAEIYNDAISQPPISTFGFATGGSSITVEYTYGERLKQYFE